MSHFPSYLLLAWLFSLFGWSFIFGKYRASNTNWSVLRLAMFLSIGLFLRVVAYLPCASGQEEALLRASETGMFLAVTLFLDYAYQVASRPKDRWFYAFFLAAVTGGTLYCLTDLAVTGVKVEWWGPMLVRRPWVHWTLTLPVMALVVRAFWIIATEAAQRREALEKKALWTVFGTSFAVFLLFLAVDMDLPEVLWHTSVPRFGAVSSFVVVVTVAFLAGKLEYMAPKVEEMAENLIAVIPDGVVLLDQKGVISRVNEAASKILGISVEKARGKGLHEVSSALPESGVTLDHEVEFVSDGVTKVVELSRWEMKASDVNLGSVILLRDVTSRKEAEKVLESLNEELKREAGRRNELLLQKQKMETVGALARGIAHDYNNYLNVMAGSVASAMAIVGQDSPGFEELETVMSQVNRAKNLVKQILEGSKTGTGAKGKKTAVIPLVAQVSAVLQGMCPEGVQVHTKLNSGFVHVDMSETELEQVLFNLGKNGIQAMQEKGGVLALCVEKRQVGPGEKLGGKDLTSGPYVKILVQDQGVGIPEDIMEKVFEPMFTTKPEGQGTGLGLVVVKSTVEKWGGAVQIESYPGKGTKVTVLLPESNFDEVREEQDGHGKLCGAMTVTGKMKEEKKGLVMVVDDMELVGMATARMVQLCGYDTELFTDSLEALKAFERSPEKYSKVVSDLTMPGLNGVELAERFKLLRSDVKVVVVTGYAEEVPFDIADLGQNVELLGKPLDTDRLSRALGDGEDR